MSSGKMTVDKMTVDKMTVYQIRQNDTTPLNIHIDNKLSFLQLMNVDKMSLDILAVDKMTVDKMTVDKMTHRHRITQIDKK